MDSSVALVQAASGLEKLMTGSKSGVLKENIVAKISATLYYQSHVLAKLNKNKAFINKFNKTIYDQIAIDFGLYMDSKARREPKSLHHVYEWRKVGSPNHRLFKLERHDSEGIGFTLRYSFKESKLLVPTQKGKHRHVFANKAFVMEQGEPVVIRPKNAERLVFDVNGYTVFMPKGKSVNVSKPGGVAVKNSFAYAYSHFFKGNLVNESIRKSKFQNLFSASLSKAFKVPMEIKKVQYRFSPNTLNIQADQALTAAFGGVL